MEVNEVFQGCGAALPKQSLTFPVLTAQSHLPHYGMAVWVGRQCTRL